ncbi:MAG: hypothetical protein LBW85_12115 [Deltaproteobacteria bacterium]|jgi:uncharacterized membrane protein|nr:hypothetical protein [Deltaproteobacteria bacterium]
MAAILGCLVFIAVIFMLFFIGIAKVFGFLASIVSFLWDHWLISLIIFFGMGIIGYFIELYEKYQEEKKRKAIEEKYRAWKNLPSPRLTLFELDDKLSTLIDTNIQDNNTRDNYIFSLNNEQKSIPYGRANAFLNYFGENTGDNNQIYYFSAIRSLIRSEIKEYGTLISRKGIYILSQSDNKLDDGSYRTFQYFLPFSGVINCSLANDKINVTYIEKNKNCTSTTYLPYSAILISPGSIQKIFNILIESSFTRTLYNNNIINDYDIDIEFETESDQSTVDLTSRSIHIGAEFAAKTNFNEPFAETKRLMDGSRGHGYAAEYGGNIIDRLKGKHVVNAAQQLDESGRQVKHGADRIVDGVAIQTKYYKTPAESIGAAFEHKQARYLNPDGTMMVIEVPSDQYHESIKLMQKRIDSGQVPNAKPGTKAEKFVKKGYFTYSQSFNIAKSGTIESVSLDIINGAIYSAVPAGITALFTFATSVWNGKSFTDAIKDSLKASYLVLGKSTFIYLTTMQLSRSEFANIFVKQFSKDGIRQGFVGINNPIAQVSNYIATSISNSRLAQTSIGDFLGLNTLTGKGIISGSVLGVVIFGPDLVKAISGKISRTQFFKNSAIGAGSLAGAAIGQALIPVPVVGAMVGATVSGLITKKVLDQFVEDDSVEMFQIFKEEFLECSTLFICSDKEFNIMLESTVYNKKITVIMQNMYKSNNYRIFAKQFINEKIVECIKMRKTIKTKDIDQSLYSYYEALDCNNNSTNILNVE